jgi:hypothetical protein
VSVGTQQVCALGCHAAQHTLTCRLLVDCRMVLR